ncbi:MAG: hypothetical protein H6953_18700 [Chromatiaceae bacterium]|nr:hypothetical protein [Chromatiaceae bacterium]
MQQEPLDGKLLSKPGDQALLDAYYQELIKQAERFTDLAKELFKLEVAIPETYVATLRLVGGGQSVDRLGVSIALGCWAVALMLALRAIFPRKYEVLENVIRTVRSTPDQGSLSIEE